MHIAMISEHANPLAVLGGVDAGGQNVHVAALSTALAKRGHRVTVFTRRDSDAPQRVALAKGVDVVHVEAGPARPLPKDDLMVHMEQMGRNIASHLDDDPARVIHSHFWMSGIAALTAIEHGTTDATLVHTYHALGTVKRRHQAQADTSPAERIEWERTVGTSVDVVIATCSDEVFELKAMGVPAKRISVVPCGVDVNTFTPEVAPRLKPSRTVRIACVGRLVPRKGVGTAIQAIAALRERGMDNIELHIVGGPGTVAETMEDPEARRLAALAAQYGVSAKLRWWGRVEHDDLPAVINSMDAVVCTPWYEPFGIVPLEAMAMGKPVVASTTGGLIDTVIDRVTGLHVPPRDAQATADAIASLASDPALRAELGAHGRERARRRYTWERVAEATEKVYLEHVARSATFAGAELASPGGRA